MCVCMYIYEGGGRAGSAQEKNKIHFQRQILSFAYTLEGRIRILSLQTWHKLPQREVFITQLHFVSLSAPFSLTYFSRPPSFLCLCN